MRILVFANLGMGLYKFRKELLQTLISQGNEVCISLPYDEYVPLLEKLGCEFIETRIERRGTNPITDLKLIKFYTKIIRSIKPNIVLTYTIKPNVYGGIACRLTNTAYIANVTGLGTSIENKGFTQKVSLLLYRMGLKNASCVFFQNDSNRRFFIDRGIVPYKTRLIPGSGVNLADHCFEEYPNNDDNIIILFVGRIMKDKGIHELFEAATRIKGIRENIKFEIIGDCEENYQDRLTTLENQGIIHYFGQQEDVHSFIKKAHAVILPSYHEGLANVLLEASSSGRPLLASRVPGCSETFDEGESGIGFEVKSVDSLVASIISFADLTYCAKKTMGLAGRKKMEKEFSREIVIDAYINEIDKAKISKENL